MSSHETSPVVNDTVFHPLDPITAKEVQTLKEVLAKSGYGGPNYRYSYVMLREPDHATLNEFKTGDAIPREIGALLLNLEDSVAREIVVDIPAHKVVHERMLDPAVDGWSPIMDEDYVAAENVLRLTPTTLMPSRSGVFPISARYVASLFPPVSTAMKTKSGAA